MIFLDLDNTLIYSSHIKQPNSTKIHSLLYSTPRPNIENFLKKCNELAPTNILTAANKSYAKEVINKLNLGSYIQNYYSILEEMPFSIYEKLNLVDKKFVHVDDLSLEDILLVYKLNCLGITNTANMKKCFVNIQPFYHNSKEDEEDYLDQIISKMKYILSV